MRIASVCLGLVLISLSGCLLKGPAIVNEKLPEVDLKRQVLDIADYSDAAWDRFGFYDGGGRFEHQYGGNTAGYFEYKFRGVPETPGELRIEARLSAESNDKGKPEETSDVTLSINGIELGTQSVMPDDMEGRIYTWKLSDPEQIKKLGIKVGEQNSLRLGIKPDAAHKNGLCVYGKGLQNDEDGKPITIEMPTTHLR